MKTINEIDVLRLKRKFLEQYNKDLKIQIANKCKDVERQDVKLEYPIKSNIKILVDRKLGLVYKDVM